MAPRHFVRGPMVLLFAVIGLTACQSALIYGERTSFDLAAIQLNDQVSEPVRISIGFSRSVATVAPPRGVEQEVAAPADGGATKERPKVQKGEAVSVFSNFDLKLLDGPNAATPSTTLPLAGQEDLHIRTRFASGQAAITLASNPNVVAAIMGVRTVRPDTPEIHTRKQRLVTCVKKMSDNQKLKPIADKLKVTPNEDDAAATVAQIITAIGTLSASELADLEKVDALKSCP